LVLPGNHYSESSVDDETEPQLAQAVSATSSTIGSWSSGLELHRQPGLDVLAPLDLDKNRTRIVGLRDTQPGDLIAISVSEFALLDWYRVERNGFSEFMPRNGTIGCRTLASEPGILPNDDSIWRHIPEDPVARLLQMATFLGLCSGIYPDRHEGIRSDFCQSLGAHIHAVGPQLENALLKHFEIAREFCDWGYRDILADQLSQRFIKFSAQANAEGSTVLPLLIKHLPNDILSLELQKMDFL
jgi:hypothetical protein